MRRESRFFSLNKPSDWETGIAANVSIRQDGITVNRTEAYSLYRTVREGDIDGADSVADFAAGPGSKLYVLDARACVWVHDYENRHTELLYPPGHRLFTSGAMLAARDDALHIADPFGERRISSVYTANGQLLWTAREWNGLELFPLAAAAGEGRRLYTAVPLDVRDGEAGEPDVPRGGRIAVLEWSPAGEPVRVFEHGALRVDEDCTVRSLLGRYHLTVMPDGAPALLDSRRKTVLVFRPDGSLEHVFAVAASGEVSGLSADSSRLLYVGDSGERGKADDDRFILSMAEQGERTAKVPGYRSRVDKLLHDGRDRLFVFNAAQQAITLLALRKRTMTLPDTGLPEARYITGALDSTEDETEWHKIELDADIPEETQIRISYFASDQTMGVVGGQVVDWDDYFADPSVPFERKWQATRSLWSAPIVNPQDALLQNAKGRYLRLCIELVGSDRTAPTIRRLRVHFPRQSPIDYLPPIYQQDPDGTRFLERFLAMFGTFFAEMEERIDNIGATFDPDAVAGPYLKWLGGWLALDIADGWDDSKLRMLIKQAPELYRLRGTRTGLARMLQLYTGVEPYIVEHHQLKHMQETSELRQLFERLYGDNPYGFCVMLPPECVRTDRQRLMVEKIIEDQKPAYAEGWLIVLQPWMHADMHTYVGVNTVLSEPSLLTLDERSTLPHHTVLIDVDRDKRIDIHTRLELDSELD